MVFIWISWKNEQRRIKLKGMSNNLLEKTRRLTLDGALLVNQNWKNSEMTQPKKI